MNLVFWPQRLVAIVVFPMFLQWLLGGYWKTFRNSHMSRAIHKKHNGISVSDTLRLSGCFSICCALAQIHARRACSCFCSSPLCGRGLIKRAFEQCCSTVLDRVWSLWLCGGARAGRAQVNLRCDLYKCVWYMARVLRSTPKPGLAYNGLNQVAPLCITLYKAQRK